jgi:hypothetical protein
MLLIHNLGDQEETVPILVGMQDVNKNFINETVCNNLCKYEQQNETK